MNMDATKTQQGKNSEFFGTQVYDGFKKAMLRAFAVQNKLGKINPPAIH